MSTYADLNCTSLLNADHIIVPDNGRIVEQGVSNELNVDGGCINSLGIKDISDPDESSTDTELKTKTTLPPTIQDSMESTAPEALDQTRQTGNLNVHKIYFKSMGWSCKSTCSPLLRIISQTPMHLRPSHFRPSPLKSRERARSALSLTSCSDHILFLPWNHSRSLCQLSYRLALLLGCRRDQCKSVSHERLLYRALFLVSNHGTIISGGTCIPFATDECFSRWSFPTSHCPEDNGLRPFKVLHNHRPGSYHNPVLSGPELC